MPILKFQVVVHHSIKIDRLKYYLPFMTLALVLVSYACYNEVFTNLVT